MSNLLHVPLFMMANHKKCFAEERRLEPEEKPLLVQLNWHKDDREGRFLLRRIDDKTNVSIFFLFYTCVCIQLEKKG